MTQNLLSPFQIEELQKLATSLPEIDLQAIYDELFPICRSITGLGFRQSLKILQRYIPFTIEEYKSGSQVCNWTVPPEWELNKAELRDSNDQVILSTEQNPMCLLNYSVAFKGRVSREELESHLYTLPEMPAIQPYVTSYYKKNWGFCLTEQQKEKLCDDFYDVFIDTKHKEDGAVLVGSCELKGKSNKIVMLSSYLCHPCMLNNELSGPLTLIYLYVLLSALPERQYTYRFIINPETIGSICYLSHHSEELKERLEYGMVLTCLATQYKTGNDIEHGGKVSPKSVFDQLLKTNSSASNWGQNLPYQFFHALLNEIRCSYASNFLDMPLIFKMSRQSMMDEIHWALGHKKSTIKTQIEQDNTWLTNHPITVKERYYPNWDKTAHIKTTEKLDICHKQDISKMQFQMDSLRSKIALSYGNDSKDKKLPEPSFYTYACDQLLFSWQAQRSQDLVLIPFTPLEGSDERQYCSALMNLPVISAIRTMYSIEGYPFYHTVADNQNYFSLDSIPDSALKLFDLIELYERRQGSVKATNIGEPQLGKYQLYPDVNNYNSNKKRQSTKYRFAQRTSLLIDILKILSFADGSLNLIELIKIMNLSPYELMDLLRTLESKGLLLRTEYSYKENYD